MSPAIVFMIIMTFLTILSLGSFLFMRRNGVLTAAGWFWALLFAGGAIMSLYLILTGEL